MASRSPVAAHVRYLIPGLVVATLCVVTLVWIAAALWLRPPIFEPIAAHTAWQQRVQDEVGRVTQESSTQDVERVLQNVLALRVTSEDRDAQLALVVALSAFQRATTDTHAYANVRSALEQTQR